MLRAAWRLLSFAGKTVREIHLESGQSIHVVRAMWRDAVREAVKQRLLTRTDADVLDTPCPTNGDGKTTAHGETWARLPPWSGWRSQRAGRLGATVGPRGVP
jgi:hypothetical protein